MRELKLYIDSRCGDDFASGTSPETAWASLEKLNSATLNGGDEICFRRSCVWQGQLVPKRVRDGKKIRFCPYGEGERPLIDGNGAESAVLFENFDNLIFEGFEIVNLTEDCFSCRSGLFAVCRGEGGVYSDICFRDLYIHDVVTCYGRTAGGLIVWADKADSPVSFNNLAIENCFITDCGAQGITVSSAYSYRTGIDWTDLPYTPSDGIRIRGNYISRCGGDAIFQSCGNSPVIEHNVAADCCFAGNTAYAGIWPHNSQDTVMRYNESFGNRLVGGDGQGYDVDINCTNTTVYANYSHQNGGGNILLCTSGDIGGYNNGITVEENVSIDDGGQIFTLSGPIRDIRIKNNTVYVSRNLHTRLIGLYQWGESGGGPDDVSVEGNDFELNTDGYNTFYEGSVVTFSGNRYAGTYNYDGICDSTPVTDGGSRKLRKTVYGFEPF